jgi:hypothetical protein
MTASSKMWTGREFATKNREENSTMSNWYRKRVGAVTVTLGAVACGLLGGGAGTALAGSNGQQINYYSHVADGECTTGTNQSGNNITNCLGLRQGSNPDQGYWWVGPVSITWHRLDGSKVTSTCDVPREQNGDFFNCYEP